MNVVAYCAAEFVIATREAAGVEPMTCPPLTSDLIDPTVFAGRDLIFLDLHGNPDDQRLAGSYGLFALEAGQIRSVDLHGAVVFASTCYLGDENSPVLAALLDSGAKCVAAGAGKNFSPAHGASYGAALLGLWFRRGLERGLSPDAALNLAKRRVQLDMTYRHMVGQKPIEDADSDALNFRLFCRN